MAEYAGRLPLFHQDLYRLGGAADAIEGGLLDERQDAGVTLSEWAERLESGFDPERLEVRIGLLGDEERRIELVARARTTRTSATWTPPRLAAATTRSPAMTATDAAPRWRLVIDTATRQSTVALGDGPRLVAESRRASEHRHGALVLEQIEEVLARGGIAAVEIGAIGVGTGPGSFTGLRVGLATAKTLAYGDWDARSSGSSRPSRCGARSRRPRGGASLTVVMPAGARDHYLAAGGQRAAPAGAGQRPRRGLGPGPPGDRRSTWPRTCLARKRLHVESRRSPVWQERCWRSSTSGSPRAPATTSPASCRRTWRYRGASAPAAEGWHGRPTSGKGPHRADDASPTSPTSTTSSAPAFPSRGRPTRSARSWRRTGWRATWSCRAGDETVAYAGIWLMVDEAHVTTFAVMPDWRRRGIGGRLMLAVLSLAEEVGASWRRSRCASATSAARTLYQRFGFRPGRRAAALLLGQRRGRPDHDHRPARLADHAPPHRGDDRPLRRRLAAGRGPAHTMTT